MTSLSATVQDESDAPSCGEGAGAPVLSSGKIREKMARLSDATDEIVKLTGQAFYIWDIPTDRIEWSRNFAGLVNLKPGETAHLTGRRFETLLGSQSRETRFGIIQSGRQDSREDADEAPETSQPVSYQCVYLLQPDTDSDHEPLWIEDTGCWFPDEDGNPFRAEGSIRVINDRRQREETLRRQSDFDDLTGLLNRRSMEKQLVEAIEQSKRTGTVSSFMILCVERMNLINDIYGFEGGDFVLRRIGEIIKSKLRADDIICRFSGAKFGLILKDCPPAEIYDAGERLLDAVSRDVIETPKGFVAANGVIGACFLPRHGETPTAAIHSAFRASRNARLEASRRVSVHAHSPEIEAEFSAKAAFSAKIIKAVEAERIQLAYQPVCRSDGSVAFHEALIRMTDEKGGHHVAESFIRTVEELGLVRIVDKHALKLVLRTLAEFPNAILSVNISQDTVLDPDWLSLLASGIAAIENGASRLIVEITESMAITEITETRRFLENLRALGCRVAIDDFGAGFTSFANLKHLPVDIIKIDGSFATNLASSKENQAFVQALLSLAKVFDIETVVEWVEDETTSDLLNGWKVDYQQGHRFGMPTTIPPWIESDHEEKPVIAEA